MSIKIIRNGTETRPSESVVYYAVKKMFVFSLNFVAQSMMVSFTSIFATLNSHQELFI